MSERIFNSLVFRTGATLAAIVLLTLANIVASIAVAERMDDDAQAINVAGSVRMQAYYIGMLLEGGPGRVAGAIAEMQQRLDSPQIRRVIASVDDAGLEHAHGDLRRHWEQEMLPLLAAPAQRERYLASAPDFIDHANHFVADLQRTSEDQIRFLQLVLGISMFLTLALVFGAMYELNADVIAPLGELVKAARSVGEGDFSVRVGHARNDELGVLGRAFNAMAENISGVYGELEARVRQQTDALQRNNDALVMLYRIGRLLTETGNVQARLPSVLGMIAVTLRARPAFFGGSTGADDFRIVTPDGEYPASACVQGHATPPPRRGDPGSPARVFSYPVESHNQVYGQLFIEEGGGPLDPWADQVLRSVAELLATALSLSEGEQDQRRILLMEERAVIARELHDSLAQSLSYLKIQVSRLDSMLARGAPATDLATIIDDLRTGLNSAYRQLRELLTTFRLRIEGRGFHRAIDAAVDEFSARGIDIRLDFRIAHCALAANEEIHALQVVREALSNIVRHARASSALVSLRQRADGRVEIIIEDDGIGMPPNSDTRQHHGLVIMRERATTLGGTIDWRPVSPQGTRVTLDFHPAYLKQTSSRP